MKKRTPTILLIILLCWISCDKIEPPYIEAGNQSAEKTILIEKFTGHKCSNCPEASRKVDELKDAMLQYGNVLTSEEVDDLISNADVEAKGEFSYAEFVKKMMGISLSEQYKYVTYALVIIIKKFKDFYNYYRIA